MNPNNITPYIRYSVYRRCQASGWKINTRTIPDHEFVLITRGCGKIVIDSKIYTAKSGMLFYFYPGLPHSLESSNENPMHFFGIHFSFSHVNYSNNQWTIEAGTDVLPLPHVMETKNYIKLSDMMKEINTSWNRKEIGYQLECNGTFMKLLYNLLEDFKSSSFNYSSRIKIQQVISFIEKNYNKKLTIAQLAQIAGMSPDYLSSVFKSCTGLSIIKYINKYKIDIAKLMLIEHRKNVNYVAAHLGFKDEFYFSRVFKKLEGISPSQFLNKESFNRVP